MGKTALLLQVGPYLPPLRKTSQGRTCILNLKTAIPWWFLSLPPFLLYTLVYSTVRFQMIFSQLQPSSKLSNVGTPLSLKCSFYLLSFVSCGNNPSIKTHFPRSLMMFYEFCASTSMNSFYESYKETSELKTLNSK